MPIGPKEPKKDSIVRLTNNQRMRLDEIAAGLQCHSGSGPTAGQPSWRVMVAGIADGVLVVRNPKDKAAKKERRAKKARKLRNIATPIPGAPDWWQPFYGNAVGLDHAMKKQNLTREDILALGLRIECNMTLAHPEVIVGKPEWPAPFLPTRPHWWWEPVEDGTMLVEDAVMRSGMPLEALAAAGMIVVDDWLETPPQWNGWRRGCQVVSGPPGNEWEDRE